MRILVDQTSGPGERQRCLNCRYFDIDLLEFGNDRHSTCRRYPPVYIAPDPIDSEGYEEDVMNMDNWNKPIVGIGDWCGEWAAREWE